MTTGAPVRPTHAGNTTTGTLHNRGISLSGNNFQGNVFFGSLNGKPNEAECKKALFLTNPVDDRGAITTAKSRLVPEVCQWILDDASFRAFHGETGTELLWITGGPGMGKTMMSLFLLRELETNLLSQQDTTILFYFVGGQDEKRNTSVSILRGLIFLLLQSRPRLITHLLPDFEYQRESLFSQDSLEALWRILETMLKDEITGKVVFLIDGLDECREESLQPLLRKICDFVESRQQQEVSRARGQCGSLVTSAASVKMVLVSREAPDCLSSHLSRFPRVRMGAIAKNGSNAAEPGPDPTTAAQLALEGMSLGQDAAPGASNTAQIPQPLIIYIETKIAALSQEKGFDEAFQLSLREALHDKGDGSFLWVDLAIKLLDLYAAEHAPQLVQHHLMPTVDEMHCQFLQYIPESMIPVTAALLRWVVVARRPPIVPELAAALTQMGFAEYGSIDTTRQVVDLCGPLLSISEDETVHITHTSVKDFLTAESGPLWWDAELFRFHVNVDDVNWDVAGSCVSYLEQGCLKKRPVSRVEDEAKFNERLLRFPLVSYAIDFWPDHLRSASGYSAVNLSSVFFRAGSKIRKNWWLSYYPDTINKPSWTTPRDFNLLHLAAYLNLASVAHQLKQEGQLESRLNSRNSKGETPLEFATIMGSIDMFIFLMQRGASPPLASAEMDLIELACYKGRVQILEYLLNTGWDVNSQQEDINWRKAAGIATRFRGANAHAKTTTNWTALHMASWTGREDCVKLLIEHGADLLGVTDEGWNPMHCAASRGETSIVSLFLELGVPVDAVTAKSKTALHLAAYKGHVATMRALITAGAAVDAQSHLWETPLHLAARSAEPEAVEILLSAGADGLISNSEGKNAVDAVGRLEGALIEDSRETLRILQTYGTPGYVPWKSSTYA
ncbi:hypothetical protein ACJ41O_001341 [Fusarium nematophilum]